MVVKTIQTGLTRDELLIALSEMPPHTHYVSINERGDTIYCNVCDCAVQEGRSDRTHYEVFIMRAPRSADIMGLMIELRPAEEHQMAALELYDFLMLLGACSVTPDMLWDQVEVEEVKNDE